MGDERYAADELASLGGVTRRTVRYYVQEGLIPPPLGSGRGSHYGREHLQALLRVKGLQEQGQSLDDIRRGPEAPAPPPGVRRAAFVRIELLDGIEVQVSGAWRVPSPGRLQELQDWCRKVFRRSEDDDGE